MENLQSKEQTNQIQLPRGVAKYWDLNTCYIGFSPDHLLHSTGSIVASGILKRKVSKVGYKKEAPVKDYWWWQVEGLISFQQESDAIKAIDEATNTCYNKMCEIYGPKFVNQLIGY